MCLMYNVEHHLSIFLRLSSAKTYYMLMNENCHEYRNTLIIYFSCTYIDVCKKKKKKMSSDNTTYNY